MYSYPIEVFIEDTDYAGVVYHSNYLKYFERARSSWLIDRGFDYDWLRYHSAVFAVVRADIKYIKSARLGDKLRVISRLCELRKASVVFEQLIVRASFTDEELTDFADVPAKEKINFAKIKVACLNSNLRPRIFPSDIFKELISDS